MTDEYTIDNDLIWNDLYHKTGKCIILFQKIESIFKYAVSRGCFSFVVSSDQSTTRPIEQLKKNADAISQKTMGCVGRLFCDRILNESSRNQDSKDISKNEMRIHVNITLGAGDYAIKLRSKIEDTIVKRNKIVHNLFDEFNLKTKNDIFKANLYLDETYENALILYNEISELTNHIPELIKNGFSNFPVEPILNDQFNTDYEKELIVMMQYYAELRMNVNKSDGWTNLADTGGYLSKQCPIVIKQCKIKHKTKSLKKIIDKFDLFEFRSAGDNKQNVQFRMKPGIWLEKDSDNNLFLCKMLSNSEGYIKDDLGMTLVNEVMTQ